MIVTPDVGLLTLLADLIAAVTPYYHLYQTDINLTQSTVLGDFEELDAPDYKPMRAVTWSPPVMRNDQAVTEADPIRWIRGAGGTPRDVYGYYVTDGKTGPLLWAERGAQAPYSMRIVGDVIVVSPRYALGQCKVATNLFNADLTLSGFGRFGPAPMRGLADLILDGASSSPPLMHGLADLILDGASTTGPPNTTGHADLVLDAINESPLYPLVGHADLVLDAVGAMPYSPTVGDADLLLDGEPLP